MIDYFFTPPVKTFITAEQSFIKISDNLAVNDFQGAQLSVLLPRLQNAAGILQSVVYDKINKNYYAISSDKKNNGVDIGFFQTFKPIDNKAFCMGDGEETSVIGHQGLGIIHRNGVTKLIVSSGENKKEERSNYIVILDFFNGSIDNETYYRVWDKNDNVKGRAPNSIATSYDEKYFAVVGFDNQSHSVKVKVFLTSDLDKEENIANKSKYYWIASQKVNMGKDPLQALAIDSKYIYILYGLHTLNIYTLDGKFVQNYTHNIGYIFSQNKFKSIKKNYYEPESLFWIDYNGQVYLAMSVAISDGKYCDELGDVKYSNYIYLLN